MKFSFLLHPISSKRKMIFVHLKWNRLNILFHTNFVSGKVKNGWIKWISFNSSIDLIPQYNRFFFQSTNNKTILSHFWMAQFWHWTKEAIFQKHNSIQMENNIRIQNRMRYEPFIHIGFKSHCLAFALFCTQIRLLSTTRFNFNP